MARARPAAATSTAASLIIAGTLACGGADEPIPTDVGNVSCTADARLDPASDLDRAGEFDKRGEQGVLSFRFFDLDPAQPAKGLNTLQVEVTGVAGEVVPGQLRVDLRMPDHGHGTSVEPIISADSIPGTYSVRQLFLFMPGVWRLEFEALDATREDAMLDRAVLHFCIEG